MIPFVLNNFKLYIKNLAELSWEVKIETGKGGGGGLHTAITWV